MYMREQQDITQLFFQMSEFSRIVCRKEANAWCNLKSVEINFCLLDFEGLWGKWSLCTIITTWCNWKSETTHIPFSWNPCEKDLLSCILMLLFELFVAECILVNYNAFQWNAMYCGEMWWMWEYVSLNLVLESRLCYCQGSTLRPVGSPMRPAFTQWWLNFHAWSPTWPPR